jgi:predicted aspartyl protease
MEKALRSTIRASLKILMGLLLLSLYACNRPAANPPSEVVVRPPDPPAAIPVEVTGTPVETRVPVEENGGTFLVPVTINDAITLKFTIDSGASSVHIPADVASTLIRAGTISREDFIAKRTFTLADGSTVPGVEFRIRKLQVGTLILRDVVGSIGGRDGSLLLGQAFLSRLSTWSFDNEAKALSLKAAPNQGELGALTPQLAPVQSDDLLGNSDIENIAINFDETLKERGMSGVISEITECYESMIQINGSSSRNRAAYCLTMDLTAYRVDSAIRKSMGEKFGSEPEPDPFFAPGKLDSRFALYMPHTGYTRGPATTRRFDTYANAVTDEIGALIEMRNSE